MGEELALVYTASCACRYHTIKWVSLEGWLGLERLAFPLDYLGEKNLLLLALNISIPNSLKIKVFKAMLTMAFFFFWWHLES